MSPYARRGLAVRCVYLAIAVACRLVTPRRRPVTLCYHGVARRQRDRFARQMAWLARRGGAVRVTCDDAFANLLEHGLPVAAAHGVPVTVFAVSGNLGDRPRWDIAPDHPDAGERTMTADELARAAAAGACRVGAHGVTHRRLTGLSAPALADELAGAKAALEAIIGAPVTEFAFPHGACDRRVIAAAFDAGYERVHTLDPPPGVVTSDTTVARAAMSPDAWPLEFSLTAAGAYRWLPSLRRFIARVRGNAQELRLARSAAPTA